MQRNPIPKNPGNEKTTDSIFKLADQFRRKYDVDAGTLLLKSYSNKPTKSQYFLVGIYPFNSKIECHGYNETGNLVTELFRLSTRWQYSRE